MLAGVYGGREDPNLHANMQYYAALKIASLIFMNFYDIVHAWESTLQTYSRYRLTIHYFAGLKKAEPRNISKDLKSINSFLIDPLFQFIQSQAFILII